MNRETGQSAGSSVPLMANGLFMPDDFPRESFEAILTATRTGEVMGARWDELDLQNRVWAIPAERMKASKEHRVPLSERAVELLSALSREVDNPHVFIGMRAGSRVAFGSRGFKVGFAGYTL
jgi:integrase